MIKNINPNDPDLDNIDQVKEFVRATEIMNTINFLMKTVRQKDQSDADMSPKRGRVIIGAREIEGLPGRYTGIMKFNVDNGLVNKFEVEEVVKSRTDKVRLLEFKEDATSRYYRSSGLEGTDGIKEVVIFNRNEGTFIYADLALVVESYHPEMFW